ncbi:MAG: type II toxin-antitoxin system RelE family toxin [Candidatus Hodarchaeales archaeon]|jgi:mRNA-degrading endonuclease RelE of RelBE toxin-antitoxin system
MIDPLPVRRTLTFQNDLKNLIPKKNRNNLIYELEHISKDDLKRHPLLKSPSLKPYRSYRRGDLRILFVYCSQCFHQFNKRVNCKGCDKDDLEKLILVLIDHRSKIYRYNNSSLTNFTLYDE